MDDCPVVLVHVIFHMKINPNYRKKTVEIYANIPVFLDPAILRRVSTS
jgi:hypothetical protein